MSNSSYRETRESVRQEVSKLLNLIENVLRYQVLTNVDSIVSDTVSELTDLISRLSAISSTVDQQTANEINSVINSMKGLIRVIELSDAMIKRPIRVQVRSLSGIRRFTLEKL